ncbi:MAG: MOSC domain-containing protein [Chloracidobacterium sp.]|nr:MOSC domain-containing protein [Chloracidobacterium sp.]
MILSEINIYPVKSLKGIQLSESPVEARGLRFDRRWMLVDGDGQFMTQRDFPKMALIETSVNGKGLAVRFDGWELAVPAEAEKPVEVGIWEGPVAAAMFSDEVNRWFSEVLEADCRLVTMPKDTRRLLPAEFAVRPGEDHVSFADGYPLLLIGEGSLAELNSRLETPVPMNRFRPNLVVAGSDAFAEDTWKKIRVGETIFHLVKPCARCVLTTVDQATGIKNGKEPLRTLASFRTFDNKVLFGENLIAENPGGTVRVGDEVEVLEKS